MAALVVRSTAPTADTPILTLRPVVPIYPPLELPIRLFCVVHVHPHFQRAWLAEHLRARNADGHLLCLCPGTKEPLALMLCSLTPGRRGRTTLKCRLLCLDKFYPTSSLGRTMLFLAAIKHGACRIEASIDPKSPWMVAWWQDELGFLIQGSLAVLDDISALGREMLTDRWAVDVPSSKASSMAQDRKRNRCASESATEPAAHRQGEAVSGADVEAAAPAVAQQAAAQQAVAPQAAASQAVSPVSVAEGALEGSQAAVASTTESKPSDSCFFWQGHLPRFKPMSGSSGVGDGEPGLGKETMLTKAADSPIRAYLRWACAGPGQHVVKLPAAMVLPPGFDERFGRVPCDAQSVCFKVICMECHEYFRMSVEDAVEVNLDVEMARVVKLPPWMRQPQRARAPGGA